MVERFNSLSELINMYISTDTFQIANIKVYTLKHSKVMRIRKSFQIVPIDFIHALKTRPLVIRLRLRAAAYHDTNSKILFLYTAF